MRLSRFRPLLLGTLSTLTSLGAIHCGGIERGPTGEGEGTADLTTPTGANLIVLPRPPGRVSAVYTDSFVTPFGNASVNATTSVNTTTKYEGASSLAVVLQTANAVFASAINAGEQPYSAASQTELVFSFNAGAAVHAGIADLAVAIDDDDAATPLTYVPLKPLLVGAGNVAPSTWYRVSIPLATLNPNNLPLRKVLIANRGALTNVNFLVDDIRLSWTDAAPVERSVYADTVAPSFLSAGWSITSAADAYRTTGANALKATYTAAWGAYAFVYDWNAPAIPVSTYTTVSFDISAGAGTPPAAMNNMRIGLDSAPTKVLANYIPGGFKANTWHRVTIPVSELTTQAYRWITFKNESTSLYSFYVDNVRFQTDNAAPPLRTTVNPGTPDTFAAGEVDVVTNVRTADDRKAISPWIYGINSTTVNERPAAVLATATFVRRGGDRSNAYNWETNASNGSHNNGYANDMYLAGGLANPNAAGALDSELLLANRAANRGTMVPFVLNGYAAGALGGNIPYLTAGWNRDYWFRRVDVVKPTALSLVPDLNDGVVYTDEHLWYLKNRAAEDVFAAGPKQLFVGTDNEPDLFASNFPMLQTGSGGALTMSGVTVGTRVTGDEFTARFVKFAKRVKQLAPTAAIVGPDHYAFDGWTSWHGSMMPRYNNSGNGPWYMDDFLKTVKTESEAFGQRLLETWDMHWYPQTEFNGIQVNQLDNSTRAMTAAEIDAVLQGPRSYWDPTYDENSWITRDHLRAPAYILSRLQSRIDAYYPGTKLGVTEYFPGGRGHISSGLATVDSLGVFARMGVGMAAMWPHPGRVEFAYGGLKLVRNPTGSTNGAGVRFADTNVRVEHPEVAQSSVFAASDTPQLVTVLVVNKTNAVRKFGLRAFNTTKLTTVKAYRIDAAHADPFLASTENLTKNNAYAYSAPAMSATLLVFQAP